MPRDEDDDLYDEEFDFVDDDESEVDDASDIADDGEVRAEEPGGDRKRNERRFGTDRDADADDGVVDEYGRPEPKADYVVHIYEHQEFKRTIDRPFTPEDAEAFATEYNRTSKTYGRVAVTGKNDSKPKKALD